SAGWDWRAGRVGGAVWRAAGLTPAGLKPAARYAYLGTALATRLQRRPPFAPKVGRVKRKGSRPSDASPCVEKCRREDSNLHSLYGNQVLNLARLPIPPLRLGRPLTPTLFQTGPGRQASCVGRAGARAA